MPFFLSLILACHQKDPDPALPQASPPQEEEVIVEPPPPPPPTTAQIPLDPWTIHPSLQVLKQEIYAQQYDVIIKKQEIISSQEHKAILVSIAHLKQNSIAQAIPFLPILEQTELIPSDYRYLLCAYIYIAQENIEKAASVLEEIPSNSPFYTQAQTLLLKSIPTEKQFPLLLKQLPNTPVDLLPLVLSKMLTLAPSTEQRFFVLKQIFTLLPKSPLAIETNDELKKLLKKKGFVINQTDRAIRAESLMRDNQFASLTSEYKQYLSYDAVDETMCRILYAYGRSLFKTNNVTASQKPLLKVAQDCKGITDDLGAKAYYIAAKGLDRKKEYAASAELFAAIAENYPTHSMADDGYILSGIGWQNADNLEKAIPMWAKQIEKYPDGDMIFEGYWRTAWGLYVTGKTKEAISWSDQSYKEALQGDITHAMALRYWGARWKIYPDFSLPNQENTDPAAKEKGIQELEKICSQEPTHFYALLAAQILRNVAPQRLAQLQPPAWLTEPAQNTWTVQISYLETDAYRRSKKFAEMGLLSLALQEGLALPRNTATEHSIFSLLESKVDPVVGHDRLHKILNHFAPSQFEHNHITILNIGYPQTYWSTVQAVTPKYRYDARIFHALVREESSFNPDIVSWAGAKGLSQLMPATAKQVAGWMDLSLKKNDVFDPETNLKLGSRYLNHLHEYFHDNSFMAVGSYNAGAGNMNKWYEKYGPAPVDHLVEQIPIRETRGYIKRVLGTYQLYSTLEKRNLSFPDWSSFQKSAQPQ